MTKSSDVKIGVIGAGAWGTALACVATRQGCATTIWSRNFDQIDEINSQHTNNSSLPDIRLDPILKASFNIKQALAKDIILLVIPTQQVRSFCFEMIKGNINKETPLIICCKGIEQHSGKLMSEVVKDILPEQKIAILSGPNFAKEIALGLPAATTLAIEDNKAGEFIISTLASNSFRIYSVSDMIAPQIGGAVKNVLAIAAGIVLGRNFGENARAALLTRGLTEMKRLCVAKGGKAETLLGLSGVGDLILACTSLVSRNAQIGYQLAQGEKLADILAKAITAEGIASASSVAKLAEVYQLQMPICQAVHNILHQGADIETTILDAFSRYSPGSEID